VHIRGQSLRLINEKKLEEHCIVLNKAEIFLQINVNVAEKLIIANFPTKLFLFFLVYTVFSSQVL
jgi:hypothetical protein